MTTMGRKPAVLTAERRKPQKITAVAARRIIELYNEGLSIRQVVAEVGYSYGSVHNLLRDRGIVLRPRGGVNGGGRVAAARAVASLESDEL
jgi:AcrR family transcriptional regulator